MGSYRLTETTIYNRWSTHGMTFLLSLYFRIKFTVLDYCNLKLSKSNHFLPPVCAVTEFHSPYGMVDVFMSSRLKGESLCLVVGQNEGK